ncbi:aminotransferase class V-fold PLP-dependent enzyme [Streptomyces spiramenti]|uniref:Aminotransferase class V-fold PLP-dependent enzyme n=1 Tax=Streptomyces spiramenti TaxID=2720606 RepID=A0ABX1AVE3_9ACTN|nr:aminotransferase class V-fold PLP-dependent enzyme [Streptomyces spiramenti]NJP68793.1 aminotransferase class V-fold PLP-dependent enzyme [Streptomyces spiramenti]
MPSLTAPAAPRTPAAAATPAADVPPACPPPPLAVLGDDVRAPLTGGGDVPYAALDLAASAPAARAVWEEVADYLPLYGSVHRGAGHLSRLSTDLFERDRRTVAEFLGCRPDDQVVFTRSTTDSLNLLAAALPADCTVLVFETEHHAALLPWEHHGHRVVTLPAPASPADAVAVAAAALRELPVGRPALLCVTGASNVTGELWPVAELAEVAREYAARTVLDAAQLVPHRAVDVTELGVDWVAFSGHKVYAPFGAGVLAGRADWLDEAEPYLAGGGASLRVDGGAVDGLVPVWQRGPARHEAGSPNVVGVHALAAACRALSEVGYAAVTAHEQALLRRLRDGLSTVPAVRELSLFGPDAERVAVVSFVVEGRDSAEFARRLSDEFGIGVRAGLFCAHPLLRSLLAEGDAAVPGPDAGGCDDSPVQAVRASFGAGTPVEHVDRLVSAVRRLTAEG